MVIVVLLGILICVAWVIWFIVTKIKRIVRTSKSKKNISEMTKYLSMMEYFKMEKVQFSIGNELIADQCLAIDDRNKLICILKINNNLIKEKVYKYEVLQSCEIVENGKNVIKEICLIVIFKVTSNSAYKFNFMPYSDEGISYRKYIEVTKKWQDILSIIMKRNQEERLKAISKH